MHPEQRRGIVSPQLPLHPDLAIQRKDGLCEKNTAKADRAMPAIGTAVRVGWDRATARVFAD